jgi:DNA-directed RNA polymerase specialized sigma24 family protein
MNEGCSVDVAAKETNVSSWTIYSAKARLMKRLREELDGLL